MNTDRTPPSAPPAPPAPASPPALAAVGRTGMRQRTSDRVYAELLSAILDLRLAPGASLSETELADQLGVSRTPLREAIARLVEGDDFFSGTVTVLGDDEQRDLAGYGAITIARRRGLLG